MSVYADATPRPNGHILQELGFAVTRGAGEVRGSAPIAPEMWVPGTASLRASILATWADVVAGHQALDLLRPRVPVTLELDVHVYGRAPGEGRVHAVARTLKAGRAVVVLGVEFADDAGEPVAVGHASFMAAPDPRLTVPADLPEPEELATGARLQVPFAERARCERREPGVAVLHRSEEGLNISKTMNGGLVALVVEEAALSAAPGAALASLALRYLRPVRVGPAVATAEVRAGLGRVEVRDAGSEDRLAVQAITRTLE